MTLSATLAFFGRRFGFVADQGAMIVFFPVESVHGLVPFRPAGHLDKTEAFGLSGKLIHYKLGADHATELTAKFAEFRLGDIIREATDKKFHA